MLRVSRGQRIGRGTVLDPEVRTAPTPAVPYGRRGARLRCDCGTVYVAPLIALVVQGGRSPNTSSCGCLGREQRRAASVTHGMSGHALYQTWSAMLDRCENPAAWEYPYYGGRGVAVCERWHDIRLFVADVEGEIGPKMAGMTLDRTENDGNYEPGNIRWADRRMQVANRHQPVSLSRPGLSGAGFARSEFYRERMGTVPIM